LYTTAKTTVLYVEEKTSLEVDMLRYPLMTEGSRSEVKTKRWFFYITLILSSSPLPPLFSKIHFISRVGGAFPPNERNSVYIHPCTLYSFSGTIIVYKYKSRDLFFGGCETT